MTNAFDAAAAFTAEAEKLLHPRRQMESRGNVIYGGPTNMDAAIGEVYDNGQPHPDMVAKIWASAGAGMFPVLALIRNTCRDAAEAGLTSVAAADLFRAMADAAAKALPVPTIGDEKEDGNG